MRWALLLLVAWLVVGGGGCCTAVSLETATVSSAGATASAQGLQALSLWDDGSSMTSRETADTTLTKHRLERWHREDA